MRFVSIFLSCVVLCVAGCSPDETHDKDVDLIAVFRKERPTFDRLLSMIQVDHGLERVDDNWTLPDPPNISQVRLAEYRKLLKSIGCTRGFENFKGKNEIIFIASASGMATGGSSKGYYYSEVSPSPLVEDLDSYRPGHNRSYAAFHHLEGNWYLSYEYDD